jgi:ABC-type phosphate/phosphonate transport system substrate-binding protein
MAGQRVGTAALVLAAGLAALGSVRAPAGEELKTNTVRIGLTGSLFRDMPAATVQTMLRPFQSLLAAQTGLSGNLVPGIRSDELGQQLKDDKLQFAVYQGFEFAWARQKHPDLRPLMLAVSHDKYPRAFLLVRGDGGATKLRDLKGRTIAVARRTREYCHLFLERRCAALGAEAPADWFGKVIAPLTPEEAVDAVVNGQVDAALADSCILNWYEAHKPTRFARLKVIEKSEAFPAAVIAYYANAIDEATLRRFREGMLSAKDNPRSLQLMTLCQISSFEPVPDDYDKVLSNIARAYPPAEDKK